MSDFRQEDINIDVSASLASLHTKVDKLLEIEARVSSLELWRYFLSGTWAATVGLILILQFLGT